MRKSLFIFGLMVAAVAAQEYKTEAGGAPPAELSDSVKGVVEKQGLKLMKDGKPLSEIWFRAEVPAAAKASAENNLTMPNVPHGTLLGVIRVDQTYADRRGQTIKAGLYTMRYSYFPENGDHQGAAPQRDFLVLTQAAADTDGASTPNFDTLITGSRKATGTPHPGVLSIWKEDPKVFKDNTLEKQGEQDWVLMHRMGSVPVSMIVIGKSEA